jgi:hypothetical protein
MYDADDATRLAIELRLRLEETGTFVDDEGPHDLRRTVDQYVGALKALGLTPSSVCAALRAILDEAGVMAETAADTPESSAPRELLHNQVIAWGTEAYSVTQRTE